MIKRLLKISSCQSLKFNTVKRLIGADTSISNAYYIKFDYTLGSFSTYRQDQINTLRNKLKIEFFPLDLEIYFIDNCAIVWIERTLKDDRKQKLEKLNNVNKE